MVLGVECVDVREMYSIRRSDTKNPNRESYPMGEKVVLHYLLPFFLKKKKNLNIKTPVGKNHSLFHSKSLGICFCKLFSRKYLCKYSFVLSSFQGSHKLSLSGHPSNCIKNSNIFLRLKSPLWVSILCT